MIAQNNVIQKYPFFVININFFERLLPTRLAETACEDAIRLGLQVCIAGGPEGSQDVQVLEGRNLLEKAVHHEWMARFYWKYTKCEDCKTFAKVFTFGKILGIRPFKFERIARATPLESEGRNNDKFELENDDFYGFPHVDTSELATPSVPHYPAVPCDIPAVLHSTLCREHRRWST